MTTAYIDGSDVSGYLGRVLTDAEQAQVDAAIDAACVWVEDYTGRSFDTTAVVDEPHEVIDGSIYVGRSIGTLTAVKLTSRYVGATSTTLTTANYSLWSATGGRILTNSGAGTIALVSYVPGAAPASVILATAMLAASMLAPTGDANQQSGIKRYSVGSELTVEYFDASTGGPAPSRVLSLLAGYRRPVFA